MIIHEDLVQLSDEWFDLKKGKFSGTDFTTVANGKPATRKTLCYKKAAEIITGEYAESTFRNFNMDRGIEMEEEARMAFDLEVGVETREVGFIELSQYAGVSPDGLIGDYAGLELKCKDAHTHLECLLKGDNKYKWQIQGALFVSGRSIWYFASYNPSFPVGQKLYIKEHLPDPEAFEMLAKGLDESVANVQIILEQYKALEVKNVCV